MSTFKKCESNTITNNGELINGRLVYSWLGNYANQPVYFGLQDDTTWVGKLSTKGTSAFYLTSNTNGCTAEVKDSTTAPTTADANTAREIWLNIPKATSTRKIIFSYNGTTVLTVKLNVIDGAYYCYLSHIEGSLPYDYAVYLIEISNPDITEIIEPAIASDVISYNYNSTDDRIFYYNYINNNSINNSDTLIYLSGEHILETTSSYILEKMPSMVCYLSDINTISANNFLPYNMLYLGVFKYDSSLKSYIRLALMNILNPSIYYTIK